MLAVSLSHTWFSGKVPMNVTEGEEEKREARQKKGMGWEDPFDLFFSFSIFKIGIWLAHFHGAL